MSGRLHRTNGCRTNGVAAIVLLLLLASACAGDPTNGATASPEASPTPEALQVEGGTAEDVLEPASLPGGSPLPVADDPAGVVQALLDALDDEDFATQRALTVGSARTLMRIRDVIRAENNHRGGTTTEQVNVAEPPTTTEQQDDSAVVLMDATLRSTVSGDREPALSTDRLQGPVDLVRTDGRWLVTSLVYDGRPLVGERPDVSQTRETVRFEVAAMLSYEATTGLLTRLVPTDEEGIAMAVRSAHLLSADDRELPTKVFAVERQSTPVLFFGFERTDQRPTAVRIEVERTDTGATWTYEVRL